MEVFNPNSNIDFLGWRRVSLTISAVLVIIALGAIFTRGLNYGLDFTGGVLVEAEYKDPVETADVRAALQDAGFGDALVQSIGGSREVAIRLQVGKVAGADASKAADSDAGKAAPAGTGAVAKKKSDQLADDVFSALKAKRQDVSIKRTDIVGPQVGEELKSDGVTAVLFVIIGIMIYIGIRFEWRFAIAAIASEFHDTILTVGFYALTQHEFDITVLASVLAVVGYSINDKVVVFDRVREIFRSSRKGEPVDILNRAINSTLSRTIITALFTAVTMIALYFFGGPVVHGFALTMIIGIVIGTLSSIFFANPILLWLGVSKKDLMPVSRDNPELARRP
ncbi:MAG TPA: protein translocase subunit SecF [Rhodanobacteraceae bacterium]|jgi:preprotein translocase subunit SecF|nr:protein translocase subunit SecF [Rhodanobacteraceae bacterium]